MKYFIPLLLWLSLFSQVAYSETEPNDDLTQANQLILTIGQPGTLSGADVNDWFELNLSQSGILTLTFQKTGSGNGTFYLRDGEMAGEPEITNMYLSYAESPVEGWIWTYPLLAGKYYVQVNKNSDAINYTLTATLAISNYPEDAEPNDNLAQALPMPPNGAVSGNLHYYAAGEGVDQEDWYKLVVPQGGILKLTIHKRGNGNAWFYFKDGEMAAFPELSNFYFQYWESAAEGWTWSYPVLAGTYFFQIANGGGVLDYQLVAMLTPATWGDDFEPNDTLTTAQVFPVNDSTGGTLGYYRPGHGFDNWDWFKVTTGKYGLLAFNIAKKGGSNGNLHLRNSSAEVATQYMSFGDLTTTFSKIVPAGIYYLGFEKLGGDFQYKVVSSLLPKPIAGFTYNQTGNIFTFENTTLHNAACHWDFDDGTTATTVNAYHEYAEPGNFNVCLIATNVAGADTVCQLVTMPGVARALPAEGGNTGDVTVQVFGGGLDTNYVAKIMNGTTVIATSNLTRITGKSSISVRFDLRDKPVGNYQLRIEKAGGSSYTVPGGFKIVQGIAADPWIRINGRNRILFNTWTTYTVEYGNNGNVDATVVPAWLLFSRSGNFDLRFLNNPISNIDPDDTEPPTANIQVDIDTFIGRPFLGRVYPLMIPVISPGVSKIFQIQVKTSENLKMTAWAEKPWFQSPINEQKMNCVNDNIIEELDPDIIDAVKRQCVYFVYNSILVNTGLIVGQPSGTYADVRTQARIIASAIKSCGITDPVQIEILRNQFIQGYLRMLDNTTKGPRLLRSDESCSAEFEPQNPTSTPLTAVNSLDPNEKSGPSGFGTENYLRDTRSFPYTIHFENMDTASAPAHTVTVTDQLNMAKFDLATFNFGNVYIGDSVLYVEPGLREFVLDKKMGALGVTARVHGKLDMQTGLLTWTFRSLNATTLEEIEDPDIGFLPPNVNRPEGQGAVSFFVKLKNVPQHEEQVKNSASIVFDANPAIATNEHLVTFDLVAPQSAILPVDPVQGTANFELNWSGSDQGSGVQYYNIYYILNGTDTVFWLGGTTETTAIFTGEGGNTYEFYSVAVDNAGNVEAPPAHPDAVTTIMTGTEEKLLAKNDIFLYPNPASDQLTIVNRSASDGFLTLVQADGRVVAKLRLQGQSQQQVSVANVPQGLLQWHWIPGCEGDLQVGRVLIVR
jgi:PKD repeat protein